jgi:hypothetical protein
MHPEIEKFWEDTGYTIVIDILQGTYPHDLWRFYWVLLKDEWEVGYAGISEDVPQGTKQAPCTTHFLHDKKYTEEEMLKIIRLKAFL